MYDLNPLKFIKIGFVTQNVLSVLVNVWCALGKTLLLLLGGVFHKCQLGKVG